MLHRLKLLVGKTVSCNKTLFTRKERSKFNSQKNHKKVVLTVLFIIGISGAIITLNYMNRTGATDWNKTISWTTTADFNTGTPGNIAAINVTSDNGGTVELKNRKATAIAAGGNSSFVIKDDGTLLASGDNATGALGLSDTNNRSEFTIVPGAHNVMSAFTTSKTSFYINSSGDLYGTGQNGDYELGLNNHSSMDHWVFTGLSNVKQVETDYSAMGFYALTVALKNDGTVWVTGDAAQYIVPGWSSGWAKLNLNTPPVQSIKIFDMGGDIYNVFLVLSDGTVLDIWSGSLTTPVDGLNNVGKMVSMGYGNPLIINRSGTIAIWSQYGDWGNSAGITNVADMVSNNIYSGYNADIQGYFGIMLKNNNTVWTIGQNSKGALGDGINSHSNWSQTNISGAISIAAGLNSSMVLKSDGTIMASGDNSNGQLGKDPAQYPNWDTFQPIDATSYTTNTISNFKIDAGVGNAYKWNTISWGQSLPANTAIKFRTRGSSVAAPSIDSDWSAWSGYYTTTSANITTSPSRWLEIEATLVSTDGVNTPTLTDFSVNYFTDNIAPTNVNTASAWTASNKNTSIDNNSYKNIAQPYFEFSGATDEVNGSGIAGYYVYFGQEPSSDPFTAGTFINNISDPQVFTSQSIAADGTYYLIIKTKDNAGNISTASTLFTYKYDHTAPSSPSPSTVSVAPLGWSLTDNFTFNWTADVDEANGASGIAGYQYKLGNGNWSNTITDTSISDIHSYQNGQNTFFVRSVDIAGNIGVVKQTNYYFNGEAPSAPKNLTVDPTSSDTNSFTFEWDLPDMVGPGIKGYRYVINAPNSSPNDSNTTFINLNSLPPEVSYNSQTGHVKLSNIPAATQQGTNTLYIVAVDTTDKVAYDTNNVAKIEFTCNTSAPGSPVNIEAFDTSNRGAAEYSVAIKWAEPVNPVVGFKNYDIQRSTNGTSFSYVGSSAGTSFIDTELNNRQYYYRVLTRDNSGNVSAPSEIISITPTGRYTLPPVIAASPEVTAKVSTASVRWVTDRISTSFIEFGETAKYGQEQGKQSDPKVTDHKVVIAGLKPNTVYYYRAGYVDEDGNMGHSAGSSFRTKPAPRVENVTIKDIRLNTAVLTWRTSEPAISDLLYGKNTSYSSSIENISGGATTIHSILLDSLDDSSTYHFAIRITDMDGNQVISDDYSFDTLQYPKISLIRFNPLRDQATSTFKVSWVTNVPTTSIVEYQTDDDKAQESVKSKLETSHEIIISGLKDNTFYSMTVIGVDQYGDKAISDRQRVKTDYDTRPPALSDASIETSSSDFGSNTKSQIVVSWETDEPSTSQVEYGLGVTGDNYDARSQEDMTLTTSHVVVLMGLRPSSSYHVRAASTDASGNRGVSGSQPVLTEQVRSSILDIIVNSLQSSIGWLFGMKD